MTSARQATAEKSLALMRPFAVLEIPFKITPIVEGPKRRRRTLPRVIPVLIPYATFPGSNFRAL